MNLRKAFGVSLVLAAGVAGLSQVGAQEKAQMEFVTTSLQPFADFFNPLVAK